MIGVIALNIVFLCLSVFNSDDSRAKAFNIILISTMSLVTAWFTISLFVMYIRLSGTPYKSNQAGENTRYLTIIFVVWTVAFIIKIIVYRFFKDQMQEKE
jgi:uncharacterized membrane protein